MKSTDLLKSIETEITYEKILDTQLWSTFINSTNTELQIVHLNIRSLRKNFTELMVTLHTCKNVLDVIVLSEINVKQDELRFYEIDGYDMHSYTRETRRGGGLLVYCKSSLNAETENIHGHATEILHTRINCDSKSLSVISVYRPPNTNKLRFILELQELIYERYPPSRTSC